ncbi:chromosome segregation protein [Caballeronia pedi]|uniref:Chromosome segregation protein n=1 Tax=Caballeronia pedi TaxID=1777141 RepID=A0A158DVA0_9BURK|nr:AAA family ATPase [Caballeronia pedi]SAK98525.1 chromosome segregation protein [Caballeronia pedi]
MQIERIKISNILGVENLEFSPLGFTTISGRNGTGKTSVLEAIKSAFKGGHDATLLRNGADKGEIVFVLDDGTNIRRRVDANASTTDVVREGKKVPRPQEALKSLTDMLSINPVDFLRAPKKDRVRVLLEAMPIPLDAGKLEAVAGVKIDAQPGLHALHVIEKVAKQVYDLRTGSNRAVKEKEATIGQLRQAIPPAPAGIDGDETVLTAKLNELNDARNAEMARISTKLEGIRADAQKEIDEIKAKAQADIDAVREKLAATERAAATQRERSTQRSNDEMQPVSVQLQMIRENRDLHARRAQTLDTIENLTTELEELREESAAHTQALADIEQYKSDLLANLPIPGVEVKDGEIYRNSVPLDRLNTAQQVDIAVEVAKLRAGDIGVICVDGIELLDSDAFEAFRERALDSGLQMFVSKVTDDEFAIDSEA